MTLEQLFQTYTGRVTSWIHELKADWDCLKAKLDNLSASSITNVPDYDSIESAQAAGLNMGDTFFLNNPNSDKHGSLIKIL